jgi:hypothetical protein
VDDAARRGFGADGWVWISNLFAEGYPTKFFMRGWHSALDWVIWSRENKCLLMLPYDPEQPSRSLNLELQLHLALPRTSASNPTTIGVRVDDGPIENFHLSTDDEILTVISPNSASKFRGVSLVEFHLGAEISAGEGERLHGSMGMGVKRFRYPFTSLAPSETQLPAWLRLGGLSDGGNADVASLSSDWVRSWEKYSWSVLTCSV